MLGTNVGQKAAKRVNIGCNEDKIWVFKPNPSQILSKDIIKTKVRHLLDIFWYWTKPGQKFGDLHCTPAPSNVLKQAAMSRLHRSLRSSSDHGSSAH